MPVRMGVVPMRPSRSQLPGLLLRLSVAAPRLGGGCWTRIEGNLSQGPRKAPSVPSPPCGEPRLGKGVDLEHVASCLEGIASLGSGKCERFGSFSPE